MVIRGRNFSNGEIEQIKVIVRENPDVSRRQLSFLICEQLDWRQPNGLPKDRSCRDVLLRLAAKKIIKLPSAQYNLPSQPLRVYSPEMFLPNAHLQGKVDGFGPLHFSVVSTLTERRRWNYLIAKHHYLGIKTQVSRHLKFFLYPMVKNACEILQGEGA